MKSERWQGDGRRNGGVQLNAPMWATSHCKQTKLKRGERSDLITTLYFKQVSYPRARTSTQKDPLSGAPSLASLLRLSLALFDTARDNCSVRTVRFAHSDRTLPSVCVSYGDRDIWSMIAMPPPTVVPIFCRRWRHGADTDQCHGGDANES